MQALAKYSHTIAPYRFAMLVPRPPYCHGATIPAWRLLHASRTLPASHAKSCACLEAMILPEATKTSDTSEPLTATTKLEPLFCCVLCPHVPTCCLTHY